eukprot:CAMPEP_0205851262 /NCGR_PEP_ID=MMETSP1083-20121108/400_1 /ASSEMBLY_ACC=CAM_ASM_000430 /TAXON_ID=97485 /ORGANISM="Prymnesium parvum, Strain Texoma1" /LENGTH=147 /DNA_ID=CAMNT_0053212403 /DNA_START=507 /DNA_END=950 /DNA_ORIENTATION=-
MGDDRRERHDEPKELGQGETLEQVCAPFKEEVLLCPLPTDRVALVSLPSMLTSCHSMRLSLACCASTCFATSESHAAPAGLLISASHDWKLPCDGDANRELTKRWRTACLSNSIDPQLALAGLRSWAADAGRLRACCCVRPGFEKLS